MISYWGVEHTEVSKAFKKPKPLKPHSKSSGVAAVGPVGPSEDLKRFRLKKLKKKSPPEQFEKRLSFRGAMSAAGEGAAEAAIGTGIAVGVTTASKKKRQKNQAAQPTAPVAKGFWRGTTPESRRKRRRVSIGVGATAGAAGLLVHGPRGTALPVLAGTGYALGNMERKPKNPVPVAKAFTFPVVPKLGGGLSKPLMTAGAVGVAGAIAGHGYRKDKKELAQRRQLQPNPDAVAKALGLGEVKSVKLPRKAANSKGSINPTTPSPMGGQPKAKLTPMSPPGGTAGTGIGAYGIKRYGQA